MKWFNAFAGSAKVHLHVGPMRIHVLTVPGESYEEATLPEEFAGLPAKMTVWIPSDAFSVTSGEFLLERGARLELRITPARGLFVAATST